MDRQRELVYQLTKHIMEMKEELNKKMNELNNEKQKLYKLCLDEHGWHDYVHNNILFDDNFYECSRCKHKTARV